MAGPAWIYATVGGVLLALGLHALIVRSRFLRKVLGLNVASSGVFLMLVAFAYRPGAPPDPVPHALVLTGIVVAVSATALALAFIRRIQHKETAPAEGRGNSQ